LNPQAADDVSTIPFSFYVLAHKNVKLADFENAEWHVAHARNSEEGGKPIEEEFEHIRYSSKDEVAIYWKRK
jgi:hypothetical protein